MRNESQTERIDTVVIGAGQAGLSVGYHLSQRGVPFVILDANERIGDQWRRRWDSLRLFTPARFAGLDGMTFPAPPNSFPTKDEMGEFPRTLCANVQTARAIQHARGTRVASRRWVSRHRWHSTLRSPQRRRGHGELSAPPRATVRERTRPRHRPDPFLRLPQSFAAPRRGRPRRRSGQLRRRDRARNVARTHRRGCQVAMSATCHSISTALPLVSSCSAWCCACFFTAS